jgi:hypothetical protein
MVVLGFVSLASSLAYGMLLRAEGVVSPNSQEKVFRPFPQAGKFSLHGVVPDSELQSQLNKTIRDFYAYWKAKYLVPSVRVPGDYKVKYDRNGRTVSEAMGYGMMLAAYMAGSDPEAKRLFDGLDGFRKRFPSKIDLLADDVVPLAMNCHHIRGSDVWRKLLCNWTLSLRL